MYNYNGHPYVQIDYRFATTTNNQHLDQNHSRVWTEAFQNPLTRQEVKRYGNQRILNVNLHQTLSRFVFDIFQ